MSPLMLLALLVVVVIAFVVVTYNKMVKMRNHADEAWSDIDVQLKRRYNLIPNLVETVKGYAEHESDVFTKVTEARSNAINAGSLKEQAQAENMLSGALKSLFAVAENYPDLKANENFMQLQNELVDTEDKIQAARRFYNSTVRDFNTKLQQFPNSMIAKMFKFEDKEFFEVEDEEQKKNVEVSFDKTEKTEEAPAPEVPAEAPATEEAAPETPVEEKPAEPAKCPKCGGEMAEGHACPMPEKTEEAPAPEVPAEAPATEEAAPETPVEEKPAEPAKCPKCGGEMTEGHTCPMPEKEEEKPAEDKPLDDETKSGEATKDSTTEEVAPTLPVTEEAPAESETPKEAEGETDADKPQSEEGESGEAMPTGRQATEGDTDAEKKDEAPAA